MGKVIEQFHHACSGGGELEVARFLPPRFAGDQVLETILNDPDTGTKRLELGGPPASVRKLQQALFDLGWTLKLEPPLTDPAQFVVGEYGPKTRATVLAFRSHYKLRWPPGAPTGTYSGNAGPRTLRALDLLCVRFDQSVAAIEEKIVHLVGAGLPVVPLFDSPPYRTIPGTTGVVKTISIGSVDGAILHKAETGAWEVHG